MKKQGLLSRRLLSLLAVLTVLLPTALSATPEPVAQAADTDWRSPSADVADIGGDGDGFEEYAEYAYADGGDYARNWNGPNDRHRYYNFGFNASVIPVGSVITGIEARLDGWSDSTFGSSWYDVELSWDGGSNWSSVRSTSSLGAAESSFYVGGQDDLWGRAWSAGDLYDSNFRVRITSQSGSALSFDGINDYVVADAVTGTGPLTIEAWVRPSSNNADGLLIVGVGDNSGWSFEINSGQLSFWLSTNQGWQVSQHPTALLGGQWYHVAGTYGNNQAQTFVNGVGSPAVEVGNLTQGTTLRMGGMGTFPYFSGVLDEVRISNIVRYTTNFSVPTAPFINEANTLGLWSFDEGSGQIAADESANGNTATLGSTSGSDVNDPTWVTGYLFLDPLPEDNDFFLDWVAVRVYYASARIGGNVWADDNANGVQDNGETGLEGIPVTIYQDDGDDAFEGGGEDPEVGFDDTDTDGVFDFDTGPFMDGFSYWIDVDTPVGRYLTTPPEPRLVYLSDGSTVMVDFGYAPTTGPNPEVQIAKMPGLQTIVRGSAATFFITVTNTGDVSLSNVTVSDALAPDCARVIGDLDPEASTNYQCVRADVLANFTNIAVVTGTPPVGDDVTDSDTASVNVIDPDIEIAKTPDVQMVVSGSTVTFTIAVANSGDVSLSDVIVSDPLAPNCDRTFADLATGEEESYTCTLANVTADLTNAATIIGTPPVGDDVTDTDTASVDVINPGIEIAKTPDSQMVITNTTAYFTIAVTNTGDVTLANVTVSDALVPNCARVIGDLGPGGSTSYKCSHANVTSGFTNSATASGTPPVGPDVTDTDTAEVMLDEAKICPDSMLAYWMLNETTGSIYNDAYDGHDGACAGQCPTPVTGRASGGQAFNGSNTGINVADAPAFDWSVNGSFSIEFWMRTDSASTCSGNQVVIGRDDPSSDLHWWAGCQNGGDAIFYLMDTNGTGDAASITGPDVTDGDWHHIVAVRDASADQILLYVDGQAEPAVSASYSHGFESTVALNIGWLNLSGGFHFDGAVDEVALYGDVLSADEIQRHFHRGLAGWWYCEGGTSPPLIVSAPVKDAFVGRTYTYDVDAVGEPDPTYVLITQPAGMTIDPTKGLISWIPTSGQEGYHSVEVQASNPAATDIQSFSITVLDMIAQWKLDETSGTTFQDSHDDHDGTCGSQCPSPTTGYINGGQRFNGINTGINVLAARDFDWDPTDSFAAGFWLRTDSGSTCSGNQVVIGRDDSATNLHWWVGCWDKGQAAFYLVDTGGTSAWLKGTTDLTDGLWHHVLAVRDANAKEIRIYVDGTEEGLTSTAYTHGFDSWTTAINIGWLNLSGGFHFDGIVDEVALYAYDVTPSPGDNKIYLPIVVKQH